MLLDLSGLTRVLWCRPLTNIERDFDSVVDALIIQHPRFHLRESQRRTKQFKHSLVSRKRQGHNTLTAENLEQVHITRTSLPLKNTIMISNLQKPIKFTTIQLTLEVATEMKLWTTMMMRITTRFLCMLLWMILLFSRQLNWMQLLFLPTRGTMRS